MRNSHILLCLILTPAASAQPGGPAEPVRVLNGDIDMTVHDGRLRPAVGVENIQVLRANRTRPDAADNYGWTYNHAPMLAYWNGKFYLEYLRTLLGSTLRPARRWLPPRATAVVGKCPNRCSRFTS